MIVGAIGRELTAEASRLGNAEQGQSGLIFDPGSKA